VAEFPPPDGVAAWMRTAGLHAVTWRTMTCGIVAIHVGIK
jgi:ubiquinone/menaquinone biosynthesis C-methylase UbiE